jgi:hypothetical protein
MSEKLQEWIAAVTEAAADAKAEEDQEALKANWHSSEAWQNVRQSYAKEANFRAARLTELAAYLRDGGERAAIVAWLRRPLLGGDQYAEDTMNDIHEELARCIELGHHLPAPPAALATPGEG